MMNLADQLVAVPDVRLMRDELFARHTTFQIGGPATLWCEARSTEALIAVLNLVRATATPYVIMGDGSNVLASDKGFDGVVIQTLNTSVRVAGTIIEADAGAPLASAVAVAVEASLTGFEWAVGIPGTIGGAVRGNAGAYGGEMKDSVVDVLLWRDGEVRTLSNAECNFSYRDSEFKAEANSDVIISTRLQLAPGDQTASRQRMEEILTLRMEKFGNCISAGSVFKNIVLSELEIQEFKSKHPDFPDQFVKYRKIPAGWLIEQCDLRDAVVGGAGIYEKHAGIIVNRGGATAEDVVILISRIKQRVRDTYGIQLNEEIQYIGF